MSRQEPMHRREETSEPPRNVSCDCESAGEGKEPDHQERRGSAPSASSSTPIRPPAADSR